MKTITSEYAELLAITNLPRRDAEELLILARRINYLSIEHTDDVVELIERENLADVDSLEKVIRLLSGLTGNV